MNDVPWFTTCRHCGKMDNQTRMVRYGIRHNMHFACFLEAGKSLDALPYHEIGRFPFRLLKDRGLLDEAEKLIREKRAGSPSLAASRK
jgi:hypothetical protein